MDGAASQQFSDAQRGRPLGTLGLARMLDGARRAGAPLSAALQLARVVEAHVRAVWADEQALCPRAALRRETESQALADVAQLQSALSLSIGDLELAVERTAQQLTAGQELMAALTAELNRRRQ
jgi:hypothetical protein